ncbi:MAG: hypothetical protein QOG58_3669 [Caballeronia sp.]|jgi:hypothetical protein|nr:hypothetical protein [Caballeronia sp.]
MTASIDMLASRTERVRCIIASVCAAEGRPAQRCTARHGMNAGWLTNRSN